MDSGYVGLLMLVLVAGIVCAAMIFLSTILGPKKITPYKASPYECGVEPVGTARERFPIKFYLVAILFVLFDIEIVFLWGWMAYFRKASPEFMVFSFVEVLIYMSTWILGYVYAIKVGALEWDETLSLAKGKTSADIEPEPALAGVGS